MRIRQFGARLLQHGLGEIGAPQLTAPLREAQGQVGRAGADIEHGHAGARVRLADDGIQQFIVTIEREDAFGAGGLIVGVGPPVEVGGRKGVGHGKIVLEKLLALRRLPLYTENSCRHPHSARDNAMTEIRVFISYSHDSPEHENRVLELSDRLREDGIDANIDQYQTNPPEGWQLWMEKEIRDLQFVLLVCTETYLKRVMKEDDGRGKGVMWESTIIYSYLYEAGVVNEKFIPIVFEHENTKHIPTPLKPTTFYDVSTQEGYEALYRRLTDQPYTTKPKLGALKKLPPRERKSDYLGIKISLAKLPSTSPDLFGRKRVLKELDEAWENPKINIVSLVAWGGVGKTALVNKWLSSLGEDFRGAERVYGWSFYSQGAAEGRQVSADQFIAAALEWFGDPDPTAGSPWDKGERLAELIKRQRTLLILDGLEPLQNPPPVETGKIKDPGLTSLLRELGRQNPGLVVISTRLAVDDLKDFKEALPSKLILNRFQKKQARHISNFLV